MNIEFEVHKLNSFGLDRAKQLADRFDDFLGHVQYLVPEGRYLSIVKTKLEEACFFAKKGIAVVPENQEP